MVRLAGATASEKSLPTATDAVAWCDAEAATPLTVNSVAGAPGAEAAAVKVSVEVSPAEMLAGAKLAVTPEGRPLAESAMPSAEPEAIAVVTVKAADPPEASVCSAGQTAMV